MEWFSISFKWYFYVLLLGITVLPLTTRLFSRFPDRGYPFAKTIAIILVSYIAFLGGILKLFPFSQESLLFITLVVAFLSYRYAGRHLQTLKRPKVIIAIICEEILFFISFIALVFIRGQEPSIHGLEKFMDFGFMQSIYKSTYFPPLDMWLSSDPAMPKGYPINYYYFGHLTGAMLMKLSGTLPFIGYNLILATILGQGMTLAFSLTTAIAYRLQMVTKIVDKFRVARLALIGLLGTFLVNLAGNLHTIYLFTKGYPNENPVPFWGIMQSVQEISTTMATEKTGLLDALVRNSKYWYPNATRFIPFTIHEFPSYSYVVADLHGHVFDIPFVLLTLALFFVFYDNATNPVIITAKKTGRLKTFFLSILHKIQALKPHKSKVQHFFQDKLSLTRSDLFFSVTFGFMIAIHYMTNAFDGPIYLLLALLLYLIVYRFTLKLPAQILITVISFAVFSLPFSAGFEPFVSGVGVNCSPGFLTKMAELGPFLFEKGNCQVSQPWMLFILWGFFWISFFLFVATISLLKKQKQLITSIDLLMIVLFGFGTFLIVIPEFFYIKDIYPAHFRANTMFKMGYQAYMMMSIASAIVFYRIMTLKTPAKYLLKTLYLLPFILVALYPLFAFPSYYPGLYDKQTYEKAPELDGSVWLKNQYAEDKELIDYINSSIMGQPVILEAQGDSYTDYNRISAYTGTPTVAGWWVHEWLWRGSAEVVGERIPDIVAMYESTDVSETRNLLRKYGVKYVVVSQLERSKYPKLHEEKFSELGTKIFESKNTFGALYQIHSQ
ncbi:MAG: DUF2298 domain-containing protein [Weeksellaceae bacterium]